MIEEKLKKKDELKKKKKEERQKKEREIELVCSVCKLSKNLHDDFFKKQRSKGNNAMCKACLEEERKNERKEKEEQKKKEQEKECLCSVCKVSKRPGEFYKKQRSKGTTAVCITCLEERKKMEKQNKKIKKQRFGFSAKAEDHLLEAYMMEGLNTRDVKLAERRRALKNSWLPP